MQPNIERIQACSTDPSKQASHIDRATGIVMAHDQIDTYSTEFAADPTGKLLEAADRVFVAAAQVRLEEVVDAAKTQFEAIAKEKYDVAAALDPKAAQAARDEVDAARLKFEEVVASLKPEQVAKEFSDGFAGALAHVRFEDFIPVPPEPIAAAPQEPAAPTTEGPAGGESQG